MKKIILFFALLFYKNTNAQINKGTWIIGGSGSFHSYTQNHRSQVVSYVDKVTNIDISPSFGYFIIDKLAIGMRPSFSSSKRKSINWNTTFNEYNFSIGPFVRYYFLNKVKPYNIILEGSYQGGIHKFVSYSQDKKNNLSLMAGSEMFFNSLVGMEILFGYTLELFSINNSPSAFNRARNGFKTSIGFAFHLEKLKNKKR